jgi:chaperone required for assembly of F1-ATPase
MTLHWIISVVFTLLLMDSSNDVTTACYGSDNAFHCLISKIQETYIPVVNWLAVFNNMLFVNVSTVHHSVLPAS